MLRHVIVQQWNSTYLPCVAWFYFFASCMHSFGSESVWLEVCVQSVCPNTVGLMFTSCWPDTDTQLWQVVWPDSVPRRNSELLTLDTFCILSSDPRSQFTALSCYTVSLHPAAVVATFDYIRCKKGKDSLHVAVVSPSLSETFKILVHEHYIFSVKYAIWRWCGEVRRIVLSFRGNVVSEGKLHDLCAVLIALKNERLKML